MFKNHLEIIGSNESPTKKARFWQSFVRSLKGSDDIRAHDTPRIRPSWRPYSAYADIPPYFRSIYDDPPTAADRITSSGYRYLPVHREIYGYSPRPIYDHHYPRSVPARNYDIERAWNEHLKRMADIERRYPSRYGLYLKDRPNSLVPLEYEPEDKPLFSESARAPSVPRATSLGPWDRAGSPFRATSVPPLDRGRSVTPARLRASSLAPLDYLYKLPIYHAGLRRNPFRALMDPSPALPVSAVSRDPWWHNCPDLKPYDLHYPNYSYPYYLRDSFLSPIKRKYLWDKHPLRPFAAL